MYAIGLAAALVTQSPTPDSMVLELMVGLGLDLYLSALNLGISLVY